MQSMNKPQLASDQFNWADDFDVLEFARYSNANVKPLINIEQLAQKLQESNAITNEEYEWRKSLWRRESANERRDDYAISTMMPETKRARISSPLAPTNKSLYTETPRYCTKSHRFIKRR
jgi:hypothetical protein